MSARAFALFALCGVAAEVFFEESFSGDWEKKWKTGSPSGKEMGKWIVSPGKWFVDEEVNKGLQVTEDMRFHSISAKLDKKASSKKKDLVLQFSAKIENHQYAFCGGGYIKLLPDGLKQDTFGGDDEYHIMFGPDLCGCAPARPPCSRASLAPWVLRRRGAACGPRAPPPPCGACDPGPPAARATA